jgi:ribosomal protein L6P/L9E
VGRGASITGPLGGGTEVGVDVGVEVGVDVDVGVEVGVEVVVAAAVVVDVALAVEVEVGGVDVEGVGAPHAARTTTAATPRPRSIRTCRSP